MNVSFTSLSTFFDDYYQHQYDSQFQAIYVPTTPLIEIHEDSSDSTNEESDIIVVDELLETSNKSILNYIEKMIQQSTVDQLFSPSVWSVSLSTLWLDWTFFTSILQIFVCL